jgi:hypothetical protein
MTANARRLIANLLLLNLSVETASPGLSEIDRPNRCSAWATAMFRYPNPRCLASQLSDFASATARVITDLAPATARG